MVADPHRGSVDARIRNRARGPHRPRRAVRCGAVPRSRAAQRRRVQFRTEPAAEPGRGLTVLCIRNRVPGPAAPRIAERAILAERAYRDLS
ncbi:hypothetical protein GCM10027515_10520 [Schumannella luteola]